MSEFIGVLSAETFVAVLTTLFRSSTRPRSSAAIRGLTRRSC